MDNWYNFAWIILSSVMLAIGLYLQALQIIFKEQPALLLRLKVLPFVLKIVSLISFFVIFRKMGDHRMVAGSLYFGIAILLLFTFEVARKRRLR